MSSLAVESEQPIALFSEDGKHWKEQDGTEVPIKWVEDKRVTRIVIGSLDSDSLIDFEFSLSPTEQLSAIYPNLSHLHLWGLNKISSVPRLPETLQSLDVRRCPDVASVGALPASLDTLILNSLSLLRAGPEYSSLNSLLDLELAGCEQLGGEWINTLLESATNLRRLDLSRCSQLIAINAWPQMLDSGKLSGCELLVGLPSRWPMQLRRLELSGCERLCKLPDFPPSIDYLDLSHMHNLAELPTQRQSPRTLFLYDSGLQVPPATEHGEHKQDNVAADVAAYFADRELTGDGAVRRCKVQLLGNGAAGKTTLAYNLTRKDPALAKVEGSTPGLQFLFWQVRAIIDSEPKTVETQLWDFGGQEIYHGTHRLFMRTGSVFIVVWNPVQDGGEPERSNSGYQDIWRPLVYWVDLVLDECRAPEIIVVCSHHDEPSEELQQKFDEQLAKSAHAARLKSMPPKLYFADSLQGTGQAEEIKNELSLAIGRVVGRFGHAVPAYWEIAQDMVKDWLVNKNQDAAIPLDTFSEALLDRIGITSGAEKYQKLKTVTQSGEFDLLQQDRLRRTLNFLTRSGWIYWSEKLFQGQVIIDQEFALRGIYAVLERKDNTNIYDQICNNGGRFTRSELHDLVWKRHFDESTQKLLLSFMEDCGACFKLQNAEHAWRHETVYVSPAHLPSAEDLGLPEKFAAKSRDLNSYAAKPFRSSRMYYHHWKRYLAQVGQQWGVGARYASDGLLVTTEDGVVVLVSLEMRPEGVGGVLRIRACGKDQENVANQLREHIVQFFPDEERGIELSGGKTSLASRKDTRVFISYAWNNPDDENEYECDYEEAVDAIENYINQYNLALELAESDEPRIDLLRDKNVMKRADSIVEFTSQAGDTPKVIVVHSDKYWCSSNCLFELHCVFDSFSNDERFFDSVVISVDVNSDLENSAEQFIESWENGSVKIPARLQNRWFKEKRARRRATALIDEFSDKISDGLNQNHKWDASEPELVLNEIADRLGIPRPDKLDGI